MSPVSAKKLCRWPGCGARVHGRYCEPHQRQWRRQTDQRRGTRQQRGYGRDWEATRVVVIRRDRFCQYKPECVNPAVEVDHIIPKSQGGTDALMNLQGICKACHKEKSAKEGSTWGHFRKKGKANE